LLELLEDMFYYTAGYTIQTTSNEVRLEALMRIARHYQCGAKSTLEFSHKFATYRAVLILVRMFLNKCYPLLDEPEDSISEDSMPLYSHVNGMFVAIQNRYDALTEFISWKLCLQHPNCDYVNYAFLIRLQFFDQVSIMLDGTLSRSKQSVDSRYIATSGTCVYDITKSHGFVYRFEHVYQPIYNKDGHFVHAYKSYMPFDEFVYNIAQHPMIDLAWKQMMVASDMSGLIK